MLLEQWPIAETAVKHMTGQAMVREATHTLLQWVHSLQVLRRELTMVQTTQASTLSWTQKWT